MRWTTLAIGLILTLVAARPAMAVGPYLDFDPASGTYKVGDTFKVNLGIDSGEQKVQAVDAFISFDATKLEVSSVEKVTTPAFPFDDLTPNLDNSSGKLQPSLINSQSTYEATTAKGELLTITFKAKATGSASVSFDCAAGSSIDTNIISVDSGDIIDCDSNKNGLYTIEAGSGGEATPTTGEVENTPTTGELPQTGIIDQTIGLLIFGLVGLTGAWFLRLL